jgi:hypothetical protein
MKIANNYDFIINLYIFVLILLFKNQAHQELFLP